MALAVSRLEIPMAGPAEELVRENRAAAGVAPDGGTKKA
jgi:hypothetical protein